MYYLHILLLCKLNELFLQGSCTEMYAVRGSFLGKKFCELFFLKSQVSIENNCEHDHFIATKDFFKIYQ